MRDGGPEVLAMWGRTIKKKGKGKCTPYTEDVQKRQKID